MEAFFGGRSVHVGAVAAQPTPVRAAAYDEARDWCTQAELDEQVHATALVPTLSAASDYSGYPADSGYPATSGGVSPRRTALAAAAVWSRMPPCRLHR